MPDVASHCQDEIPEAVTRPWRIGVDVGGTFTDLVLVDARSRLFVFKAPSVPARPAEGVLDAVRTAAHGLGLSVRALVEGCDLFVHGSTVATNAVLEGKGAKVGLIATEGHRDCLDIRRGIRPNQWDHRDPYPPVIVPRYLRVPVGGRLDCRGEEIRPLSVDDIGGAVDLFVSEGVQAVAISLINSCIDTRHEGAVESTLRDRMPDTRISVSSDISPTVGEYERTSTAVLNAYLAPVVSDYLTNLQEKLGELGLKRPVLMLQSNGGAASIEQIAPYPVRLLLSGPAAGVGALNFFGHCNPGRNMISMEIGGTSCDVVVMSSGKVPITDSLLVAGYHVAVPSVEVHTVAAGGGTIARVDPAGLLIVGPQGAGAYPGPACYGRGGVEPTVTDAQLVLGRLRSGPIADGSISLDPGLARKAIETIAGPLGISIEAAAAGVIRLLEQRLLHAVAEPSIQRGLDPRQFTLVAAGGAGPMHGVSVGQQLGCATVFMPRFAGGFCALGLLASDVRQDYVQVCMRPLLSLSPEELGRLFNPLISKAEQDLSVGGFPKNEASIERSLDLRYRGQQSSLRIPLEASCDLSEIKTMFEREHMKLYGHIQPESEIDVVNLRAVGWGRLPALSNEQVAPARTPPKPVGARAVYLNEQSGWQDVDVYAGSDLISGHRIRGPLVIDEATTTVFLPADQLIEVDSSNNYIVHLN